MTEDEKETTETESPDISADRLKAARGGSWNADAKKPWSQESLVEGSPMSSAAIRRWEKDGIPKAAQLRAIADRLGVSLDWLLGRDAAPDTSELAEELFDRLTSERDDLRRDKISLGKMVRRLEAELAEAKREVDDIAEAIGDPDAE